MIKQHKISSRQMLLLQILSICVVRNMNQIRLN
nr:MAG TPA: hypothetical protein [Caudoviricetes sp.]